ncbi:MAG: DUF4349 domain-containing protein [Patescibacteria group bacterium]
MKKNILILIAAILIGLPILGLLSAKSVFRKSQSVQTDSWVERGIPMVGMAENDNIEIKEKMTAGRAEIMPMPIEPGYDDFTPDVERTIIKNASLSLVTNNTQKLVDNITNKIKSFDGLVTNSNIYENQRNKGSINAQMTVRVPVNRLEQALAEIKSLAEKVTSENISASDETERKVDMEAQLNNLKASETQLLKIMSQAKTVQDTLQVQRELTNIRERIERTQARLDNLEGAAAMSTINISISTKESELPVIDPDRASLIDEIKIAIKDSINMYRDLSISGIRLLILGLPILLIGAVGYALLKRKK